MLKRILLIWVIALSALQVAAQEASQFNPERFDAEMEQFITTEACLSPQEASRFFPVYKEMLGKQRMLYGRLRCYRRADTCNDDASMEAVRKMDELDLQIKKLQQQYHIKFCKLIPAGKVLRVIKAEEKFHRMAFRKMVKRKK